MTSKIYDHELYDICNTPVISVETDDFGIVQRAWDWVKNGVGGFRNSGNLQNLEGKHISDLDGFRIRNRESYI